MAKKVYIVCEPTRIENGQTIKSIDLTPAGKWGEMILLLRSNQSLLAPTPMIKTLTLALAAFDDTDYLVPVGDPILMCAAAGIASRNNNGRVKFLRWDRRNKDYTVIQLDLYRSI